MGIISKKIKTIRAESGLTQEEFADEIGIKRPSLGAYEEGRATPTYKVLSKIAGFAKISVEELIAGNSKIKMGKLDIDSNPGIPLVPVKAAAGYQRGFPDDEYVRELPHFTLPNLGKGNFRAFEISGDSMQPIASGTIIVGEKLERLSDLKDGLTYILVTKNEGIVYKRVFNYISDNGVLFLVSDNDRYKPYSIDPLEISEAWSAKAYISITFPEVEIPTKSRLRKQLTGT